MAWWKRPSELELNWQKHLLRENMKGATHACLRDLKGDRKPDLLFSHGHDKGIGWLVGPKWQEARMIDTSLVGPHTLACADSDGDQDWDVASAGRDSDRLAWFENAGKGNFTTDVLGGTRSGNDMRAVDLDKDGDLDLIVAGESSKNLVWFENRRQQYWL